MIPFRNDIDLNLNLSLDLMRVLPDDSDAHEVAVHSSEDDLIVHDASTQTVTAASSAEVDNDIEDLEIDSLTKDDLQEESTYNNKTSDTPNDTVPLEVI